MTTLSRLRADKRVQHIDDERNCGNGIIVTLARGWTFDALQDNRVAGADTVTEAKMLVISARPFAGPYNF